MKRKPRQGLPSEIRASAPGRRARIKRSPSPVDIIVVVDNSGSMTEEAEQVRLNINNFADILAASSLDYQVVLISRPDGSRGVCVPAPLGSGPPECESGPDGLLRAVHQAVASRNALDLTLSLYPDYSDFLRPEAAKAFLWVTDDEANAYTADSFRVALAALDPPGMFDVQIHNSIVGYYGEEPATWADSSAGSCSSLARVGSTYMRLAQGLDNDNQPIADCIQGRHGRVCETDWTDISCADGGWYFDDPVSPSEILLCPETCQRVQSDPDARLEIELGCFSVFE